MTHDTRGHCGIAMFNPQYRENMGAVARATGCFDVDYMAVVGGNYKHAATAVGHDKHVPIWQFERLSQLFKTMPHNTEIVAIDYDENAEKLADFEHPERALYVLGQEGPAFELAGDTIEQAKDQTVYIETEYCMNVAVAGNMVLRDRYLTR